MFNITNKIVPSECPMHKKQIKYINIGKDCLIEQRVGCSSCMGGDFIDFELTEEYLQQLNNGNNIDDMKQQLRLDFTHNINQFRQQVNSIINKIEKSIECIYKSSDTLIEWLLKIQQSQQITVSELKQIAQKLSQFYIKQGAQFQPKFNEQRQSELHKYASLLKNLSIQINQNLIQQQLDQAKLPKVEANEKLQKQTIFEQTPTQSEDNKQIQEINYQTKIEEQRKKIEFLEEQIIKHEFQYNKLKEGQQVSLKIRTLEPSKQNVEIVIDKKNEQQQLEQKQIKNDDGQDKLNGLLKKYLDEKTVNNTLWKEFKIEIDKIQNQINWLEIKFAESIQQLNKVPVQQPRNIELHFSKKQQQQPNNDNFSKFYLNQQIAQLQTINKLLLDSQTMYKLENVVVGQNFKDEQELKKKMQETIDYIRNHKQYLDVCEIELKYVQELMSIQELQKCIVINSRDLQKYFQRLTDKNKFGIFYINNNTLLKNSKSLQQITIKSLEDEQLRENLMPEKDFLLVNKYVWKFISTLYFSSGPEIVLIN